MPAAYMIARASLTSVACTLISGTLIGIACQSALEPLPPPIPAAPIMEQVRQVLARDENRWIAFRRDLHRHPELSGNEIRTSQKVAEELRRLGLDVQTNVGGFGVTAVLHGRLPGPLIAYRADMDAVRSNDADPVEFPSVNAGIRHICGHDVHTTVALALATALHQVRDSLAGSVMFIFQPAEETATGARAMLASGLFAAARPTEIYGLHTSGYAVGRVATTAGPMMAGIDRFQVVLSGSGDLNTARSTVSARITSLATLEPGVIGAPQPVDFVQIALSPVQTSAGEVRLSGTVSVASASSRARVASTIRNGLNTGLPSNVAVSATYEEKWIAGVTNDSALATSAAVAARSTLGDAQVAKITTIPAGFSEDFGSFQDVIPGVFFFLGVANAERGWSGLPHSPNYVADERSIGTGALVMSTVIVERLRVR